MCADTNKDRDKDSVGNADGVRYTDKDTDKHSYIDIL